jgi:hypothetical protein
MHLLKVLKIKHTNGVAESNWNSDNVNRKPVMGRLSVNAQLNPSNNDILNLAEYPHLTK